MRNPMGLATGYRTAPGGSWHTNGTTNVAIKGKTALHHWKNSQGRNKHALFIGQKYLLYLLYPWVGGHSVNGLKGGNGTCQ